MQPVSNGRLISCNLYKRPPSTVSEIVIGNFQSSSHWFLMKVYERWIKRLFAVFGLDIRRLRPDQTGDPSFAGACQRLKRHSIPFNSVLDVGASDGRWSLELSELFPGKTHLLLEANPVHVRALSDLCAKRKDWYYKHSAIGEKQGTLFFDYSDPIGGHLANKPLDKRYQPCPVTSLDLAVPEFDLPRPFLLKLDTHGVEIPILNGATDTLSEATVLVIEAYNLNLGGPAVTFWELCSELFKRDFRPIDIFDPMYRKLDLALWQFDLVFARKDLPLFADRRFRA
jgi:FkbM family methyltransferase